MKFIDVFKSRHCLKIFKQVEKFASKQLDEYINNLNIKCKGKDIFDSVWGTIEIEPDQLCVLDSPILQRLRKIKQLGFASLVYCSADYSRFSHTIGVLEISSRISKIISEQLMTKKTTKNKYFERVVKFAAIFHDSGHLFFSHVSEIYFEKNKNYKLHSIISDAISHFNEETSSDSSLHEILSAMIVYSDAAFNLIKKITPLFGEDCLKSDEDIYNFQNYVVSIIVGTPVDEDVLPYSSVLNSAIDADKIDYLSRDSFSTKIPIAVDISRLIKKIDIIQINTCDFSIPLNVWIGDEKQPLFVMALKSSAKRAFWQLSLARAIMYESVYYHHKVLTAEEMFRTAFDNIAMNFTKVQNSFDYLLSLTDDCFGDYFDKILFHETPDNNNFNLAKELINRLRNRVLFKRVVSFSKANLDCQIEKLNVFKNKIISNNDNKKFEKLIHSEYDEIVSKLNIKSSNFNIFFLESKFIDFDSMPIGNSDESYIWSSKEFKQETWYQAKENKTEQYYLVTDADDRDNVYIAFEKALYKEFGIILINEPFSCAKITKKEMNSKKLQLFEKGFYDECLVLLANEVISRCFSELEIKGIEEKFKAFQGINNKKITQISIISFYRQFLRLKLSHMDINSLLKGLHQLLKGTIFIDREFFSSSLDSLLKDIKENFPNDKFNVIKLGGPFDSSNKLFYYFNDLKQKKELIFYDDLSKLLVERNEDERILFFDDGAYSGKQMISIFQEFMGIEPKDRATKEHHVDELSQPLKDKLKRASLIFLYVCFNSNSEKYIRDELSKIGLNRINFYYKENLNKNILSEEFFCNKKQLELLTNNLCHIGKELLKSNKCDDNGKYKIGWDENRVKNSALGYNNAQQMVVFESNVPTYTLTPFWMKGKVDGIEWQGLFERTEKD